MNKTTTVPAFAETAVTLTLNHLVYEGDKQGTVLENNRWDASGRTSRKASKERIHELIPDIEEPSQVMSQGRQAFLAKKIPSNAKRFTLKETRD